MVSTISITKINTKNLLTVDLDVWMLHPDDHDFKPKLSIFENMLSISNGKNKEKIAEHELNDEQLEVALRDQRIELKVKFQVHGMHGRLSKINPIIADGKAKKLATASWKTIQPFEHIK